MTTTGKSYIVTKVFDKDCDVCQHMSRHDRATFESFPELSYQEVDFDVLADNENTSPTKWRIYQTLERYAVNPDYTIDFPVYLFLTKQGDYVGHHIGAATVSELREKVKECIVTDPPD